MVTKPSPSCTRNREVHESSDATCTGRSHADDPEELMAFANYLVSYAARVSKLLVLKHFHPYVS